MPATTTTITITNVRPFQLIGIDFPVQVSFTNGTAPNGQATVSCGGAAVNNSPQSANGGNGSLTFNVHHNAPGLGHTITAKLLHAGVVVASNQVSDVVIAGVSNPDAQGDLTIDGVNDYQIGLPRLQKNAALSGTFNPDVGNGVILFVEEPKVVEGIVQPSRLLFADPAEVKVQGPKGTWKHAAIPGAKPGQRLIVVLTQDGVAKVLLQAIFK